MDEGSSKSETRKLSMIIGVDYGLKHVGLATSEGAFASPLTEFDADTAEEAITKIKEVTQPLDVEKFVVGISEGKSKEQAQNFGDMLSNMLQLPVEFVDETLTTFEAEHTHNRRQNESGSHARAAAFILQRYLDN